MKENNITQSYFEKMKDIACSIALDVSAIQILCKCAETKASAIKKEAIEKHGGYCHWNAYLVLTESVFKYMNTSFDAWLNSMSKLCKFEKEMKNI